MANAEMLIAHDYMVYTIAALSSEPAKGTYYFDKAMRSLNTAVVNLKGDAREEALHIRKESNKLWTK